MSRKNKAQRVSTGNPVQKDTARKCGEVRANDYSPQQSVQEMKNQQPKTGSMYQDFIASKKVEKLDGGKVIAIQFVKEKDMVPKFEGEKKIIPPTTKDMLKVMQADPITALRDNAQAKQLATRKISELEAEIRRADSEISTILVRSKGFEAEIIALICNADDQDGRTIARVASTAQIESLHYHAGYGDLFK